MYLTENRRVTKNKLPLPTIDSRAPRALREAARSLAQMFLPSTTPAKRYFPAGNPTLLMTSCVLVPRTRSKPKPEMPFSAVIVLRLAKPMSELHKRYVI